MRRVNVWIVVVLAICVLLLAYNVLAYNVLAGRLTPYSSAAYLQTYVVNIAPQVSGNVLEVFVEDNQPVDDGTVLFRIDPQRYQIAVDSAEAALAQAGQSIGASTAQLSQAEARLVESRANYAAAMDAGARTLELVQRGIAPAARGVEARETMNAAAAGVRAAEAGVREARERLGPAGADNPEIRTALATLERARRDLIDTTVMAPSRGIITDRRLTAGQLAPAGQPVMTFIDIGAVWIVANVTERSLENIAAGNPVEIAIDLYPGRIFQGSVESWTWGVAPRAQPAPSSSGLPSLRTQQSGWLREAQEFPVRIRFESVPYPRGLRVGAQASVIVYTGSNPVMNALGWLWIRIVTALNYVY